MTKFESLIRDYMDAVFPILYIHTSEAIKARRSIVQATSDIRKIDILAWDGTDRICDLRSGKKLYTMDRFNLENVLDERMRCCKERQILVLECIDTFIQNPDIMARLKKFAERIHAGETDATIVIISPVLRITPELERYVTIVEIGYLEESEIKTVIHDFCAPLEIWISETLEQEFVSAFKGLSEFEIESILRLAYSNSGELHKDHISLIIEQKRQIIQKAGILEMLPLKEDIKDIGGLEKLKAWFMQKEKILSHMEQAQKYGVDMPKGVLIAGIPGCGKSLSAKAAAKLFNIPLLRLDMGRLLGKYVGESEGNMRKAIRLADALSPCVLWIDELEKAFAGIKDGSSGNEVTTRLFGSFLTWLQEKESAAFVVATANDITKLPPELLRKGRFDEIFYVGLPQTAERRKIFQIHIEKRRPNDLPNIDIDKLAAQTEGYSGADIEGVVRESVETAFVEDAVSLTTEDILRAMKETNSLSELMKDQIKKLMNTFESKSFKNASGGTD